MWNRYENSIDCIRCRRWRWQVVYFDHIVDWFTSCLEGDLWSSIIAFGTWRRISWRCCGIIAEYSAGKEAGGILEICQNWDWYWYDLAGFALLLGLLFVDKELYIILTRLLLELLDHGIPSIFDRVLIPAWKSLCNFTPAVSVLELALQYLNIFVQTPTSFL